MDRRFTMRLFKAARWMAMFALVAGMGLSLQLSEAFAQKEDGYSLMVGVPASFAFSKDENTDEAPPAKSPSGIRIMLNTPVNLGVGFGSYTSGFEDTEWPWNEREVEYSFLEIMFTIPAGIMRFGIGFGLGKAVFSPERGELTPGYYWDFKESSAQEWFVMVGAKLGDTFGIHAGFHAMTIDLQIEDTFGSETSGDLGATMGVVSGSYYF